RNGPPKAQHGPLVAYGRRGEPREGPCRISDRCTKGGRPMRMLSWFFGALLLAWPAYAQIPSVFIEDLTWPEVRDAIAGGKRTAIIYVGSSEQNGPHMVIGKHNFVARALARRIAEELR